MWEDRRAEGKERVVEKRRNDGEVSERTLESGRVRAQTYEELEDPSTPA
jgi:hypothetical protein